MWLRIVGIACALAVSCDSSKSPTATRLGSHPAGQPMKLTPADGPFSRTELLEIAYHYHPRTERVRFRSGDAMYRYERTTPQYRARDAAHNRAMANREPWTEVVQALSTAWPDRTVADTTVPYLLEPAYVVEVDIDVQPSRRIVGMVSALAPVYIVYESVAGQPRVLRPSFSEPGTEIAGRMEREILSRYPYHRLEPQLGAMIVPEIRVGDVPYGETTLMDALFTPAWW